MWGAREWRARPRVAAGVSTLSGVNHEDAGVSTELNVREGEPAPVSTVTTSRAEEAIVLVLLVKQAR